MSARFVRPFLGAAALAAAAIVLAAFVPPQPRAGARGGLEPVALPEDAALAPLAAPAALLGWARAASPSGRTGARLDAARPAQQDLTLPIDGFENPAWPDAARWPLVADLAAIARGEQGGAPWAPSDCEATEGTRALRAADDGRDCAAGYPADAASSALLALDLSGTATDLALALAFDVWMDADPDEGLLVHYVRLADDGSAAERRLVWSGTGRLGDWVRGVPLDLTALRDAHDPGWTGDLRGQRAFLEFLFHSGDGSVARGALLDRIVLERRLAPPTPIPSPTATSVPTAPPSPTPGIVERTNACTASSDCVQLSVRAYVDYRCDGRLQPGVDAPLRADPSPRVDVTAGAERLGTTLSSSGTAIFLFPPVPQTLVALAIPPGYEACPGVDNPTTVLAPAFRRGQARIDLRVRREQP